MLILSLLAACATAPVDTGGEDVDAGVALPGGADWSDDPALARIIALSPDAGSPCGASPACVDLYMNGAPVPLVGGFPFGASTRFVPLPTGAGELHVRAPGGHDAPVHSVLLDLALEEPVTVLIHGLHGAGSLAGAVLADDLAPPADGAIRVRLHHLFYGRESLPLRIFNGEGVVVASLTYGAPVSLELAAGAHSWLLDTDADGAPDLPISWSDDLDGDPMTDDGRILDVFVIPTPDGAYPMLLIHSERTQAPGVFAPG